MEIRSVIADGSASSGINKTSGGGLLLSGVNTYTGVTNVTAGLLLVQGGGSIASSSAVTVAAGTTLTFGSNTDTVAVNRVGDAAIITLTAGGNNDIGQPQLQRFRLRDADRAGGNGRRAGDCRRGAFVCFLESGGR